ncbi:MAG: glycerol-3-phosphate dehydrogenase C-terminal domain-containing protein, partial [Desulfosalsimonas sp.]
TFRVLAEDALKAASAGLPAVPAADIRAPAFEPVPAIPERRRGLSSATWRRLLGRYGKAAVPMIQAADKRDLTFIPATMTLWAELPLVAQTENIRHLTDLLLRRVRLGILCPEGGRRHLDRIEALCRPVLDWDEKRWKAERKMYMEYRDYAHSVPA